jgi:hypothetical protein
MDKKPLIGVSIIAVVLLVLGSLSNVVGYNSVKSTALNESPLFSVRTKRATNQVRIDTLTFNYLGRGIESNLLFPVRENGTGTLQQFIDRIKKMDENEFSRFRSVVVSRLSEDKNNKNFDFNIVSSLLKQIRSNTKELNINQFDIICNQSEPPSYYLTCHPLACFILELFLFIEDIILFINHLFTIGQSCTYFYCLPLIMS